jgi:hypothetical protein
MVKHHLILMEIVKGLVEVVKQIPLLFQLHNYVVNVSFNISPNLILQDDVNTLLIHGCPIFEPECHLCVTENLERRDERYFLFVVFSKADLMIA